MKPAPRLMPPWLESRWFWVILLVLPYLGFWAYGLTDLDEGFYGAVTVDMLRRGDWLTPTINGNPWFEKPILSYWLAMPTVALFDNEFGARLPSFLCTMLTCWVIARFAKRHFGGHTGRLSALIYATGLLTVAIGRMMMTDAALALCLVVAFTTFYDSLIGESRLRLVSAGALGLAVLAKGPVGIVLFFGLIGLFYWRAPHLRPKYKGHWLLGVVILLAVTATWYLPAYLANGDYFIQKFLIEQNIGRFSGGDKAHGVPWWAHPIYFPAVIGLSALPWLIPAIRLGLVREKAWRDPSPEGTARLYLWLWFLVILGFFSISGTKLVHYILPALSAFAILLADTLHRRWAEQKILILGVAVSIFLCGLSNLVFMNYWRERFAAPQILAQDANRIGENFAVFSLGRKGDDPEIKLQLDDTSHPSVFFYMDRPALETASMDELVAQKRPLLVLVRERSLEDRWFIDLKQRGLDAEELRDLGGYVLFRLSDPLPPLDEE